MGNHQEMVNTFAITANSTNEPWTLISLRDLVMGSYSRCTSVDQSGVADSLTNYG